MRDSINSTDSGFANTSATSLWFITLQSRSPSYLSDDASTATNSSRLPVHREPEEVVGDHGAAGEAAGAHFVEEGLLVVAAGRGRDEVGEDERGGPRAGGELTNRTGARVPLEE